jgi:hypothetical protein
MAIKLKLPNNLQQLPGGSEKTKGSQKIRWGYCLSFADKIPIRQIIPMKTTTKTSTKTTTLQVSTKRWGEDGCNKS